MAPAADQAAIGTVPLAELRDLALAREPDRYFAATLAPAAVRYDLIVLAAFAAEIARIPSMVNEPMAGEVRLQWWRDALAHDGAATAAGNPVAMAFRATIDRFNLPAAEIGSVIDAEADALYSERPEDEAALRARAAAGSGALFRLASRVCYSGGGNDGGETADAAGLAYGLSRALAKFPNDDAAWLAIPRSLLADDAIPTGAPATALDDPRAVSAMRALSGFARDAYADAAARLGHLSRRDRLPFLPLAMVKPNLAVLERTLSRRGAHSLELPPIRRLVRIGWAHVSGRL